MQDPRGLQRPIDVSANRGQDNPTAYQTPETTLSCRRDLSGFSARGWANAQPQPIGRAMPADKHRGRDDRSHRVCGNLKPNDSLRLCYSSSHYENDLPFKHRTMGTLNFAYPAGGLQHQSPQPATLPAHTQSLLGIVEPTQVAEYLPFGSL